MKNTNNSQTEPEEVVGKKIVQNQDSTALKVPSSSADKLIDIRIIDKDKLEAQLRLPTKKGYIEIIIKWLTQTYLK